MKEKDVNTICKILIEAGESIVEIYNSGDFNMAIKSDQSPVTLADKNSSKIINTGLNRLFPDIPVLDEENKIPDYQVRKKWKRYFLLDPLDGTKEFIKQNGEFCINLAVIQNHAPVEGWIYQPLEKKGWYCKKGEGVFEFNNKGELKKLELVQQSSKKLTIVASRSFFKPSEKQIVDKIAQKFEVELVHKGSSLKQIAMILGQAALYVKGGPCSEWDTAPGQLMIEESGGVTFLMENFEPMKYNKPTLINPHFFMLGKKLNTPEFKAYLKSIVSNL